MCSSSNLRVWEQKLDPNGMTKNVPLLHFTIYGTFSHHCNIHWCTSYNLVNSQFYFTLRVFLGQLDLNGK